MWWYSTNLISEQLSEALSCAKQSLHSIWYWRQPSIYCLCGDPQQTWFLNNYQKHYHVLNKVCMPDMGRNNVCLQLFDHLSKTQCTPPYPPPTPSITIFIHGAVHPKPTRDRGVMSTRSSLILPTITQCSPLNQPVTAFTHGASHAQLTRERRVTSAWSSLILSMRSWRSSPMRPMSTIMWWRSSDIRWRSSSLAPSLTGADFSREASSCLASCRQKFASN